METDTPYEKCGAVPSAGEAYWGGRESTLPIGEGAADLGTRVGFLGGRPHHQHPAPAAARGAHSSRAAESGAGKDGWSRSRGAGLQRRPESLRLPANSKGAAAGSGSGVQSSACFCSCFDDAFECSHHYEMLPLSS